MRADPVATFWTRTVAIVLVISAMFGLAGCKTEKPADNPTIIGEPPATAYLGVEYYYNFGAYGGERILDYSLTNAPSWLGLEDTSNKARQGIIMRGVPGITGGERGEADLGETTNINLLTTDGSMVGVQPFDITVETNDVSLLAVDVAEGSPDSDVYNSGEDYACDLPEMSGPGETTYTVNNYDENGNWTGTSERTSPTQPVLFRITLEQPSVTTVQVAFELRSEFDPDLCEEQSGVTAPHQKCEYGSQNQSRAILGQDLVGWGNGSFGDLPAPDYIVYQLDDANEYYNKGVITLEPGITECYIRLEIVDDTIAEKAESFALVLTEIREGLVSFSGGNRTEISLTTKIVDDEPSATLETGLGLSRDALNIPPLAPADPIEIPEYVVRLEGERDQDFTVRIGATEASTAVEGVDYEIQVPDSPGSWTAGKDLSFPNGVDEAVFRVVTLDTFTNINENDKFVDLEIDKAYQAGREGFAGGGDDTLHVGINELTSSLLVGNDGGFIPTDMQIGHDGRIFVAGYDSSSRQAEIKVWDRLGVPSLDTIVLPTVTVGDNAGPVLSYREKKSGDVWSRRLVISWGTSEALAGATNEGGLDLVTVLLKYDSAAVPAGYVPVWEIQSGTAGDDKPRWVGLQEDYAVFVTGESGGVWSGQIGAGGVDSFIQRIDSAEDSGDLVPSVSWTRQAGSGLDESVVGGGMANGGAIAAGNSRGSVNGEDQLGLTDFYFYNASSRDADLNVRQRGTQADDVIAASSVNGGVIWILGNSDGRYISEPVLNDEGVATGAKDLVRTQTNSQAGFLLRYSVAGAFTGAESLNDTDDLSTEAFVASLPFDEAVIAAGSTNGAFANDASNPSANTQPVLVRIDASIPDAGESAQLWRTQPGADNARIVKLANYRDDEITALVERGAVGSREWMVLLYSGDSRQLNTPAP